MKRVIAALLLLAPAACSGNGVAPRAELEGGVLATFRVEGETFHLWTTNPAMLLQRGIKFSIGNEALETTSGSSTPLTAEERFAGHFQAVYADVTTTADEVNIFRVESRDSDEVPDTPIFIASYSIVPLLGAPVPAHETRNTEIYTTATMEGHKWDLFGPNCRGASTCNS